MASVTIQIRKRPFTDGKHGVYVRVIQDRKKAEKQLFKVEYKFWNETKRNIYAAHPHSTKLNRLISKTISDLEGRVYQRSVDGDQFYAKDILSNKKPASTLDQAFETHTKGMHFTSIRKYANMLNHLKSYKPDTRLKDIDINFMNGFKRYLINQPKITSAETVSRYLRFLKLVLRNEFRNGNFTNHAVLEYSTPIGRGGFKEKLTKEEFDRFLSVDDYHLSRDAFALALYLRGARIGDVLQLQPEHIRNGRCIYIEQKNKKVRDVDLRPEALKIIERYKGQSDWYVLPMLKRKPSDPKNDQSFYKHIQTVTSVVNRDLKVIAKLAGIDKKITSHVAKHTFAHWADLSGVDSRTIKNFLNHSSLNVTESYLEDLRKSDYLDDQADKVFG